MIFLRAALEIASRRGLLWTTNLAKAQEVFARSYGLNRVISTLAEQAIAFISGASDILNFDNAQAVLDKFCACFGGGGHVLMCRLDAFMKSSAKKSGNSVAMVSNAANSEDSHTTCGV